MREREREWGMRECKRGKGQRGGSVQRKMAERKVENAVTPPPFGDAVLVHAQTGPEKTMQCIECR